MSAMNQDDIQSSLAPPGAGLPPLQAAMLRHLMFPVYRRLTSWDKALAVFETEGRRIVEIMKPLDAKQTDVRVLVKPLLGIEDSSRYWSARMVLEHLIEVGTRIATGIVELGHGLEPTVKADVADVKPKGGLGPEVLDEYITFLGDYTGTLTEDVADRRSKHTLYHPWFGHLTAHGWACLGGIHQMIHRRQMEQIVAGL